MEHDFVCDVGSHVQHALADSHSVSSFRLCDECACAIATVNWDVLDHWVNEMGLNAQ